MSEHFDMVKHYLHEMGLPIVEEDPAEELVVVTDPEKGLSNLVIDCEDPILVVEQVIMAVPSDPGDFFKRLLIINRELVHGAFVMDEEERFIIFRDTLEIKNLDRNELEGTIQALSLALAENSAELLAFAAR